MEWINPAKKLTCTQIEFNFTNMYDPQQADEWYDQTLEVGVAQLETGNYSVDPFLVSPEDSRYGITLLIRPNLSICSEIQDFLSALKTIDPNQYYYPDSDIHVTVLSIISCFEGFQLNQIQTKEYILRISKALKDLEPFDLEFKGVTLSSGAVMIRGHMLTEQLNQMRENLRNEFRNSSLLHSIDQRYAIFTAHSTVVRYRYPIENVPAWIHTIREYQNRYFGIQQVNQLELVFNDWYQRKDKVSLIKLFKLPHDTIQGDF